MTPDETVGVETALGEPIMGSRSLAGGFSHETCALDLPGRTVVVRFGGAAPAVEAAVMERAREYVPVPWVRLVHESADDSVRSFMVIDHVGGRPLSEVLAGAVNGSSLHTLGIEIARTVRRISSTPAASAPGFFVDPALGVREERPWSEQLPEFAAQCMERTPDVRLGRADRRAWAALCASHAPALAEVDADTRLVHSDFNPKNILVSPAGDGWRVDAVLDWEFSYSGCPYADAGNMLRHAADYPAAYVDGFRAGYAEAVPSARWEYLGAVLDMFALSELVTRPAAGHPASDRAAARIRQLLTDGLPAQPR